MFRVFIIQMISHITDMEEFKNRDNQTKIPVHIGSRYIQYIDIDIY